MSFSLKQWHNTVTESVNLLYDAVSQNTPTGTLMEYLGASATTGWLECDGAAVSRTTYAALFALIGTTYGVGDGSTTFNLPTIAGTTGIICIKV